MSDDDNNRMHPVLSALLTVTAIVLVGLAVVVGLVFGFCAIVR